MANVKKQTIKSLLILTILSVYTAIAAGQSMQDTIVSYFNRLRTVPKEKLYLHLDKPFYGAGENIWFKGYLQNAVTHESNAQSNFITTELIDRKDSVVFRKKIRRDSVGFAGNFYLPPELPQGDYYLRGYSNWMLNEDPAFFYTRNLQIGNSIDVSIESTIEYRQEDKKNYTAIIRFINKEVATMFKSMKIRYQLYEDGKRTGRGTATTNDEGSIRVNLPDLKDGNAPRRRLDVAFADDEYIYSKTFYLPNLSTDYDVALFPEGGDFLELPTQIIAFKAQGANGLSKDITGILFNGRGDTLTTFRSEHDGMGIFSFSPQRQESYYLETISGDGVRKRFDVPQPKPEGFALSLFQRKEEIRYRIQKTEATAWRRPLFLIAHTRGELSVLKLLNEGNTDGKINLSDLKEGITHFLLVDGQGTPLSERLCFVRHNRQAQWNVATTGSREKREKFTVTIEAKDADGNPLAGDFSVSITDAGSVRSDSLSDNILSCLLLTSDLKGYIERPGYYFLNNDTRTRRYLDFVMLTHGWRRFNLENLKEKPAINIANFIEKGQSISGRIKGLFGGNVKNAPIIVLAPKQSITRTVTTDENGEFVIDNISFPDSTSFVIQARTKRGFAGVDILIDSACVPRPFNRNAYETDSVRFMDDYLIHTRQQYYSEGGMRVINLKEVVVTAQRREETPSGLYSNMADQSVTSDRLELMAGQNLLQVVSRMPGVQVRDGEVRIRNGSSSPIVVIDDLIYDDTDENLLESITTNDIERLDILKGADASIFGVRGGGGAIVITMKSGREVQIHSKPSPGIVTVSPAGYSRCAEFYHPRYGTQEERGNPQPDLRTTLYWDPSLRFDAAGKAIIEYYHSDNSTQQNILIEGVDKSGTVYRLHRGL